jgi:hypothetical protein
MRRVRVGDGWMGYERQKTSTEVFISFSSHCFRYRATIVEAAAEVPFNLCVESHLDFLILYILLKVCSFSLSSFFSTVHF